MEIKQLFSGASSVTSVKQMQGNTEAPSRQQQWRSGFQQPVSINIPRYLALLLISLKRKKQA